MSKSNSVTYKTPWVLFSSMVWLALVVISGLILYERYYLGEDGDYRYSLVILTFSVSLVFIVVSLLPRRFRKWLPQASLLFSVLSFSFALIDWLFAGIPFGEYAGFVGILGFFALFTTVAAYGEKVEAETVRNMVGRYVVFYYSKGIIRAVVPSMPEISIEGKVYVDVEKRVKEAIKSSMEGDESPGDFVRVRAEYL